MPIVQLTENVPISDANSVAIKEVDDAGPNGAVVLNFTPPEALIILQAAQKLGLESRVKLWGCSTPCNTDFLAASPGPKWNDTMTQVAVYSMVAVGLGVLVGRVGLVSLGQVAVLAIGAWAAARLLFATAQPYPLILLEAGLITMVAGLLIGLPALRLRGLYLALITLMLAGGITVVLATVNFPDGGHGFLGYNGSLVHIPPIRRPSIAASDPAYFRYSVVVAILMFALVLAHIKTKPGRPWAAIRQSEPAALAAGINTWFYELWAFALASFITGVAGGVLAGAVHYLYSIGFPTQDSITLLAVVLMGGAYSLRGAVVAALLYQFLPAVLNNWGVSAEWLIILFGLGLAPVVVSWLIPVIAAVAESGTGVLLIEQFATVALSLARRAHIMEGGRIRFSGLASELRDQPDLLRSAYLLRGSKAGTERPAPAGSP